MNCSPCLSAGGYEKSIAYKGALFLLPDVVCLVVWTGREQPGLLKHDPGSLVGLQTWGPWAQVTAQVKGHSRQPVMDGRKSCLALHSDCFLLYTTLRAWLECHIF